MISTDRISSNVEDWLLETWFRLDQRITWADITDRIHPRYRPCFNTLQMARSRFREGFNLSAWGPHRNHRQVANELALEAAVRASGINLNDNTTRGLTPGLVDPSNPNGPRIHIPRRWLPRVGRNYQRPSNNDRLERRAKKEASLKATLARPGQTSDAPDSTNSPRHGSKENLDDVDKEEIENDDQEDITYDAADTCRRNIQVLCQPKFPFVISANFNSVRLGARLLPPELLKQTTV